MSRPNKTCVQCGKRYEICYVCDTKTRFSWREVACSPECYTNYLDKVNGDLDMIKEYLDETKLAEASESSVIEEEIISDKKKR